MDVPGGDTRRPGRCTVWGVMRAPHARGAALAVAALAACARPEIPMGGPPDPEPPQLARVTPAPGSTAERLSEVVFQFDEVVAERPAGGSLESMVIISPRDGDPRVRWRRSAITARPRTGWRPNTTYSVTLRQGIADLRGNVSDSSFTTVFSTGGPIIGTSITGVVFDWAAGTPIGNALVLGVSRPAGSPTDSAVYVAVADSVGRFQLPHVPPGPVTVYGLQDANSNLVLDRREPFDSLTLTLGDSLDVELYAFVHDSTPPLPRTVATLDSVTLAVTMSLPLMPGDTLAAANFAIVGADSTALPLRMVTTRAVWDSLQADAAAAQELAPDPADVEPEPMPDAAFVFPEDTLRPVPSRPIPPSEVIVVLEQPLLPETSYEVRTIGLRNLLGIGGDGSIRITTRPAAPPPEEPDVPPATGATPALRVPR